MKKFIFLKSTQKSGNQLNGSIYVAINDIKRMRVRIEDIILDKKIFLREKQNWLH